MDINLLASQENEIRQRIYYEDTDFAGGIYHAAYLKFFERGRTEWLRNLGINHSELFQRKIAFVVSNIEVKFISSVKIDEEIYISTKVAKITPARIIFNQEIRRVLKIENLSEGLSEIVATAKVSVAGVDVRRAKAKPIRLIEIFEDNFKL